MSGHLEPIKVCDRDCAVVNGCSMGGLQCEDCGKWYCAYEIEDYLGMWLCGDCVDSRRAYNEIDSAVCAVEDISSVDIDNIRKHIEQTIGDYYE